MTSPSAPRLDHMVPYGEEGSDVTFLVGGGDGESMWRLPAHKEVLRCNPVFKARFSKHFDQPHVTVPNVDPRAFDNLLRFIYSEPVTLQSVESAVVTLRVAHMYLCPKLVKLCVHHIQGGLTTLNVLYVLTWICELCGNVPENLQNLMKERELEENKENLSSFHSQQLVNNDNDNDNDETTTIVAIERDCGQLFHACLEFVETNAKTVLALNEMEDLDKEILRVILSSNKLNVSDETLVFQTLLRWSDRECSRKLIPLTNGNRRSVLGECLFLARYLNMQKESFKEGPGKSGLLTRDEINFIRRVISGELQCKFNSNSTSTDNPLGIPSSLQPYYEQLGRPRCPAIPHGQKTASAQAKKGSQGLLDKFRLGGKRLPNCWSRKPHGKLEKGGQAMSNSLSNLEATSSSPRRSCSAPSTPPLKQGIRGKILEKSVIALACIID